MTGPGSQAGCVQGGRAGHRPTPQGALFPEALGPWEAPPQARAGCPAQAHGALVSLQGPLLRPHPPPHWLRGPEPTCCILPGLDQAIIRPLHHLRNCPLLSWPRFCCAKSQLSEEF